MGSIETKAPAAELSFEKFHNVVAKGLRSSEKMHHGVNPSDKSELWDVPIATERDLDEAVEVAREAFKSWSKTTWAERQQVLAKMRAELQKHVPEMAKLLSLEGGKPIQFATGEVMASIGTLDYHAKAPSPGEEILQDDADLKLTLRYVPLGVAAAICPWNFPLVLAMGKLCAAILTGNTIIIKPSPFTPYSVLKFAEMIQQYVPPGVVQALNGDDRMGPMMTEHPGIDKISFTGSITTGKRVMMASAKTLKRVTLELGGNSACIICPDVDIAKVAPLVALGAFFNSGQLCVASKRLFVHESIYQEMLQELTKVVKGWKVGGTAEEGIMLGPVQNEMQYNIVKGFFEDCAVNGYEFALGGKVGGEDGFVIQPAIIDNPPSHSRIVTEEPFGPIVPMMPWSTEEELIPRVNDTRTGLGGSIYCADIERANKIASQIEAGTVWINSFERPLPQAFFSGHKESGLGGELGRHGLLSYMNPQVIHLYKTDVAKL
ncbi:aldehyde dehydrogenase [Mollisia scopiformis]|uniref:aldehyde dehydrogenase (NAD(+)) n=1 Tax=Mollisia scopiformis TaxID=149040 RepID=A0A194X0E2_MOLSC|nr:aldehyde dehydrogenase [Mollisia scopiformis]KUJ13663.1 aldehyde dehydrogenase [Mollisia scopiformis]